jgi:nitrate/nitrite transporter NarK
MFEQNNVGVRLDNPLVQYVGGIVAAAGAAGGGPPPACLGTVLALTQKIVSAIEGMYMFTYMYQPMLLS